MAIKALSLFVNEECPLEQSFSCALICSDINLEDVLTLLVIILKY
jgi:hypothetical protein